MREYQAPLADMQFVLRELVDHALIARLAGFEEASLELARRCSRRPPSSPAACFRRSIESATAREFAGATPR